MCASFRPSAVAAVLMCLAGCASTPAPQATAPSLGIATVYRTLDLLVESGLIRLHEFGDGFQLDASDRLGVMDELIEDSSNNAIVFVPYTKALDMVA